MILYLDASALVKLYVEEDGSELVKKYLQESDMVATSRISYAEARAAFARAYREGILAEGPYREVVSNFREEWSAYFALDVSDAVLQRVDAAIDLHNLRGFDALHLASALVLARRNGGEEIRVACWDARLWDAFQKEGFLLLPEIRPGRKGGEDGGQP